MRLNKLTTGKPTGPPGYMAGGIGSLESIPGLLKSKKNTISARREIMNTVWVEDQIIQFICNACTVSTNLL
jgi:hypothetical protein